VAVRLAVELSVGVGVEMAVEAQPSLQVVWCPVKPLPSLCDDDGNSTQRESGLHLLGMTICHRLYLLDPEEERVPLGTALRGSAGPKCSEAALATHS